nr:hypothetical protein [Mesorhizobium sp.]
MSFIALIAGGFSEGGIPVWVFALGMTLDAILIGVAIVTRRP